MSRPSALAVALASVLSFPAAATEGIHFHESYDKAFEEANARGVPIMIAVIQDDEEANDDIWLNTMNAPDFVKATRRTVNVVGNRGDSDLHGFEEVEEDGKRRRICGKFGSIACNSHKKNEVGIFRDFARDGVVKTPMVMLVLPDQTIVRVLVDRHPMDAFLDAFEEAERKLPNGLDEEEAIGLRQEIAHARAWIDAGDVKSVIRFAEPFRERKTEAGLVKQALALLDEVEAVGKSEMKDAESLIAAKDFVEGMSRFDEIVDRYRGSVIEKVAKERRAKLSRNRAVKAALNQAKKEGAARKLLEQADGYVADGKADRAEKLYDRIRDRFADTEAGRELLARDG